MVFVGLLLVVLGLSSGATWLVWLGVAFVAVALVGGMSYPAPPGSRWQRRWYGW